MKDLFIQGLLDNNDDKLKVILVKYDNAVSLRSDLEEDEGTYALYAKIRNSDTDEVQDVIVGKISSTFIDVWLNEQPS